MAYAAYLLENEILLLSRVGARGMATLGID